MAYVEQVLLPRVLIALQRCVTGKCKPAAKSIRELIFEVRTVIDGQPPQQDHEPNE